MYVRLAFAVASHLEPEVLILDEVLAIGNAAFQQKCLGKIAEVAKKGDWQEGYDWEVLAPALESSFSAKSKCSNAFSR